jgi:hypothetical protein
MTSNQWLVLVAIAVALFFTWLLLIDEVARGRPKGRMVNLAAAYSRFSSSSTLPDWGRSLRLKKLLVLAVLAVLNMAGLGFLLSRAPAERAVVSAFPHSASPGAASSSAGPPVASAPKGGSSTAEEGERIKLADPANSAKPFQTVSIQGTYPGGAHIFLRVQRWEAGKWLNLPVSTKTDKSGKFTAYVELGQPGRYRLRVRDPDSGMASKPMVLEIRG